MGLKYRTFLQGPVIYGCSGCRTHLATSDSIISRQFHGQHGKAYLFLKVVNIVEGEPEDRKMMTGLHTVKDVYCSKCNLVLGWAYIKAYGEHNRYKEGKVILEKSLLVDVS